MGMIGNIRKQSNLLIIVIALGMLLFLVPWDSFLALVGAGQYQESGEINGTAISRVEYENQRAIRSAFFGSGVNNSQLNTTVWEDLQQNNITTNDIVVGIAASGTTPYVVHALKACQEKGIPTGCICCNPGAPLTQVADYPIAVVVGPEFVTGSSRMKAGTAQKMILNMITTATMIRLGHVHGNKMVDLQMSNAKLRQRAVDIIIEKTAVSKEKAQQLLHEYGGIREAIAAYNIKY